MIHTPIAFIGDIIIAWALYVLLAPVNRALSLLTVWFQLVYAGVALCAVFGLLDVYHLLATPYWYTRQGLGVFARLMILAMTAAISSMIAVLATNTATKAMSKPTFNSEYDGESQDLGTCRLLGEVPYGVPSRVPVHRHFPAKRCRDIAFLVGPLHLRLSPRPVCGIRPPMACDHPIGLPLR
ncbi:DUF4386 family protein [Tunturiibacter gelidiferens]